MPRMNGGWLLAMVAATAVSATADDQEPSAGRMGLMLGNPGAPGVMDTVKAGLHHGKPQVRAAAARAAYSLGVPALAAPVAEALRAEADMGAAVEQVRALAALGGPEADTALLEASGRLGPTLAVVSAQALARARGAAAVDLIATLRARGLRDVRPLLRLAAGRSPEALTRAGSAALRDADPETWAAVLDVSEELGVSVPEGLFVAALGADSTPLRAAAYWRLADRASPVPDTIKAALERTPEASPSASDAHAAFAYDVLSRALGRKPRREAAWLEQIASPAPMDLPFFAGHPRLNALLTKEERRAVSRRVGSDDGALDQALKESKEHPIAPAGAPRKGGQFWLASGLPAGFVSGVITASGCQAKQDEVAAALVRFRADGRPALITLKFVPAAAGCLDAAKAVFAALAAPAWRLPDESEDVVVLKFDRDSLACLDEGPAETSPWPAPSSDRRLATPPKKTKNVNPEYPPEARHRRVQGVVLLEANLSPTGCLRGLRILSGPPALGVAALDAVSRWRYTPALFAGQPVPVTMTVTVSFHLR